jgi:hypothetical protein
MNDPERQKLNEAEIKILRETSNNTTNDGDVLQSIWVRYPFLYSNEVDRFLLSYHFNFLLPSGIMFLVLFLIT